MKPNFEVSGFARTANFVGKSSKGDKINWSNTLYTKTEVIIVTIPAYHKNILLE